MADLKKRVAEAKAFNPTGRAGGAPARQRYSGPVSPDYGRGRARNYERAPTYKTPSGSGEKFAREQSAYDRQVRYDRERRGAADRLSEIGARGQISRDITGMQQRGQSQRQRAGFLQALQEQQNRFGQQNQAQQNRFGQQDKLAGLERQQTLQDQYASSLGMNSTDRAKIFADTQDMYDMEKGAFEVENKGTPFQSQSEWLQSSGILQQENPRSDYLQSLMNPQQKEAGRGTVTMGGRTSSLTEMTPDVQSLFQGVRPQIQRTTQKSLGQVLEELGKSSTFTKTGGSF